MTSQVADLITYKGFEYIIMSSSAGYIFSPGDYKMKLMAVQTNCRRGWHARYSILDETLYLDNLFVTGTLDSFPVISGVAPEIKAGKLSEYGLGKGRYSFNKFRQSYSGEIYAVRVDGGKLRTKESVLFLEHESLKGVKLIFIRGVCVGVTEGVQSKFIGREKSRNIALIDFLEEAKE